MMRGLRRPGSDQSAGILLLLAAIFSFTLMDATAKYLTQFYHPAQVVWARFAGNMVLLVAIFHVRIPTLMRTRRPGVQFLRCLTQIGSVGLFFSSLQYIGLAEATAIMDINPVLITLGAALFLGESIGIRRALGIAAALAGALIIIRPGMGVFQPAAILPLIGAFTYAAGALLTRVVRGDSTATSLLWSTVFGTLIASIAVPFFWQPIQMEHLWAFLLIGVLGAGSQAMLIRAFALAEAGAIAPFGYTGLIWAGVWGALFFGQIPDGWTILGAAIIVAAGIYVWSREAALAKAATRKA
ncbi:DMT family transporter [uncultured Paracoccus sp.]|uniref:DMT family transporter n=1 Tax=uncultured Paracoccus sp. TaxID=189685 RepID=UPI0026143C7E|nr:DMT family transporter [uncultured Paracoccus sp.]